jgi:hypothetical protein
MLTDDELRRIRDHAIANPSHAGDVTLRLVAEVDRLRMREADLVADVELFGGAMRQIVLGRIGEPAPLRELLESMVREAEARTRLKEEDTPDHLEPPAFGWTKRGARVRAAVREFNEGLGEDTP